MSRPLLALSFRLSAALPRGALPVLEAGRGVGGAASTPSGSSASAIARCLVTQPSAAVCTDALAHHQSSCRSATTVLPRICDGGILQHRGFAKGKGKGKGRGDASEGAGDAAAAAAAEFDLGAVGGDVDHALEHFQHELACIRSGRATPEMLDFVEVEAYGEKQPLKAAAATSVRSAQLLVLSVYDPSIIDNVVKAIRDSPLQLNPSIQGQEVQVPIPRPTQETIKGLEKLVHKAGEAAKVTVRHARHKAIQDAKKAFTSKDDQKRAEKDVQKIVDDASKRVEDIMKHKMKSFHE